MPWLVQDNSDDVRAVAAEALLPLAHSLAADPPQALQHILWDILLEVEELSPSTGQLPHCRTHLLLHFNCRHASCMPAAQAPSIMHSCIEQSLAHRTYAW